MEHRPVYDHAITGESTRLQGLIKTGSLFLGAKQFASFHSGRICLVACASQVLPNVQSTMALVYPYMVNMHSELLQEAVKRRHGQTTTQDVLMLVCKTKTQLLAATAQCLSLCKTSCKGVDTDNTVGYFCFRSLSFLCNTMQAC